MRTSASAASFATRHAGMARISAFIWIAPRVERNAFKQADLRYVHAEPNPHGMPDTRDGLCAVEEDNHNDADP